MPADIISPDAPDILLSGAQVEKRRLYYRVKALFDGLFALLLLLLLLPLLVLIGILIVLDSPGPIFFKQTRVGARLVKTADGLQWQRCDFQFIKFRSMVANADSTVHREYVAALIQNDQERMAELQGDQSAVHKLTHDKRVTRLGHFLRKYSLDELPQFMNVLRGEMSVVGPRPALPYEVEMYRSWQLARLQALPGITGLQQVTARCTEDFDSQLRLDIQYIQQQSFWNDLVIMLKTPAAILRAEGAC